MGKATASSPKAWTVQNNMTPINPYAMISDAGPPVANAEPDPTKRPVPERNLSACGIEIVISTYQLTLQWQSSEDDVV